MSEVRKAVYLPYSISTGYVRINGREVQVFFAGFECLEKYNSERDVWKPIVESLVAVFQLLLYDDRGYVIGERKVKVSLKEIIETALKET